MAQIGTSPLVLPATCGAMVLPGLALLPKGMVPLYIFEPRYRRMLAEALEGDRMFAIAPEEPPGASGRGGIGVVRACTTNPDGTSQLVLQGIARVRFTRWMADSPYPRAEIAPLPPPPPPGPAAGSLMREIVGGIERAAKASKGGAREMLVLQARLLAATEEPGEFADLAASTFVGDSEILLELLFENDPSRRLEILAAWLSQYLSRENP